MDCPSRSCIDRESRLVSKQLVLRSVSNFLSRSIPSLGIAGRRNRGNLPKQSPKAQFLKQLGRHWFPACSACKFLQRQRFNATSRIYHSASGGSHCRCVAFCRSGNRGIPHTLKQNHRVGRSNKLQRLPLAPTAICNLSLVPNHPTSYLGILADYCLGLADLTPELEICGKPVPQ